MFKSRLLWSFVTHFRLFLRLYIFLPKNKLRFLCIFYYSTDPAEKKKGLSAEYSRNYFNPILFEFVKYKPKFIDGIYTENIEENLFVNYQNQL